MARLYITTKSSSITEHRCGTRPIARGFLVAAPPDLDDAETIMEEGETLYDTGWSFDSPNKARAHIRERVKQVARDKKWDRIPEFRSHDPKG